MSATRPHSEVMDLRVRQLTYGLTLFIHWVSAHWLFLVNLALGLYSLAPFSAPVLMVTGHTRAGELIYLAASPFCHQLPERSFFLFGPQWVYSYEQLSQRLGGPVPLRYNGAPDIGFKVAVCQRDVAIYLTMFIAGIAFVWLRHSLRPLTIKKFIALCVPMAIDGLGQLLGLWTSTWWSRVLTGGLFGLACVWLVYPYLERGMSEVRQETSTTLDGWKRDGRTKG